jgi:hypothetical protein
MQKILTAFFSSLLLSTVFAACGSADATPDDPSAKADEQLVGEPVVGECTCGYPDRIACACSLKCCTNNQGGYLSCIQPSQTCPAD